MGIGKICMAQAGAGKVGLTGYLGPWPGTHSSENRGRLTAAGFGAGAGVGGLG